MRVTDTGEPGFDLFVDRGCYSALDEALTSSGAVHIDAATADALRIEAGVPLFHADIDEETIPLEAGIESRARLFVSRCWMEPSGVIVKISKFVVTT